VSCQGPLSCGVASSVGSSWGSFSTRSSFCRTKTTDSGAVVRFRSPVVPLVVSGCRFLEKPSRLRATGFGILVSAPASCARLTPSAVRSDFSRGSYISRLRISIFCKRQFRRNARPRALSGRRPRSVPSLTLAMTECGQLRKCSLVLMLRFLLCSREARPARPMGALRQGKTGSVRRPRKGRTAVVGYPFFRPRLGGRVKSSSEIRYNWQTFHWAFGTTTRVQWRWTAGSIR